MTTQELKNKITEYANANAVCELKMASGENYGVQATRAENLWSEIITALDAGYREPAAYRRVDFDNPATFPVIGQGFSYRILRRGTVIREQPSVFFAAHALKRWIENQRDNGHDIEWKEFTK